ncbi:MAG TPA: ABC transporter ATP-binding protein [Chthoniobacterales bacterium]
MNPAIIEIEHVHKSFHGKGRTANIAVLAGIDLAVYPGEFVCLVGPSGCGKSTLLNIIAGFTKPTQGAVRIQGKPVEGPSRERIFVFQENGVFPWLNVRENIGFGVQARPAEKRAVVDRYLALMGLGGFDRAYPHELSGGMRQRVEIARALAAEPTLIFMDEPFGALDFLTRLKMRADLVSIWQQERKTIVFVTHDIEESVQLADRVIVMTPRPARIQEEVPVLLPRPRDLDTAEYLEVRDRIFAVMGMSPKVGETG